MALRLCFGVCMAWSSWALGCGVAPVVGGLAWVLGLGIDAELMLREFS